MAKSLFNSESIKEYKDSDFYWIEFEINIAINGFKKMAHGHKKTIEKIEKDLQSRINKDDYLNSFESEESKSQYFDQIFSLENRVIENLVFLQRHTLFIMGYAYFESKLWEICLFVEKKINSSLKMGELKRNSASEYWSYLSKAIQIDKNGVDKYYTQITQLKDFRVKIIHYGNRVTNIEERRNLSKIKGLKMVGETLVINDLVFIDSFFKNVEDFFYALLITIDFRLNIIKIQESK